MTRAIRRRAKGEAGSAKGEGYSIDDARMMFECVGTRRRKRKNRGGKPGGEEEAERRERKQKAETREAPETPRLPFGFPLLSNLQPTKFC